MGKSALLCRVAGWGLGWEKSQISGCGGMVSWVSDVACGREICRALFLTGMWFAGEERICR